MTIYSIHNGHPWAKFSRAHFTFLLVSFMEEKMRNFIIATQTVVHISGKNAKI